MSMKCVYSRQMTTIYSIVWFLGQMVIVSTELKPPPPTDLPSGYPLPSNRTLPRKPGVIRLGYMTGSDEQPGDMFYNKPGQAISGAITLAIKEVNEQTEVLPDHKLEFVIAETYGQEEVSIRETVLMRQKNISAYIGPQETCIHEARLAAAFNLPMISYVSCLLLSPLGPKGYCRPLRAPPPPRRRDATREYGDDLIIFLLSTNNKNDYQLAIFFDL